PAQGPPPSFRLTQGRSGPPRGRAESLRRRADFDRVYREGRRWVNPLFVAFVLPTKEGPLRVGFVASRKVGNAVQRNRAKRLLREVFRRRGPKRELPVDLVLVARGAILDAGYGSVEAQYLQGVGRWFEKISRVPG
ncbi:MAG TPA: ribonuclease P protein component, partial [Vicinamibacteria bacterium]|nr:ribonuclease P protein component [Vicinamibacteria bacterium]